MSERHVGLVNVFESVLRWTIPNFNDLPLEEGIRMWSPVFKIPLTVIKDQFLLQYRNISVPTGCLGLIVDSKDLEPPKCKCVLVGVVEEGNKLINFCKAEWIKSSPNGYFRVHNFCKKINLNKGSTIQLFCLIIKEENSLVKNVTDKEDIPYELENLSHDLKELYITGQDSDITMKVKDKEFKAHKAILRVRSSVFNAMFSHDLSEKVSGTIPIEDCEPDIFEEFLHFIYSGRVRKLTAENACELYYIADKYLIPELKHKCTSFLKTTISIETICDIVYLSAKYNETELLKLAELFFAKNMDEIILTVKWQQFLKENPVEANELTIKALRIGFTKKEIYE